MAVSNKEVLILMLAGGFRIAAWEIGQSTSALYWHLKAALYHDKGVQGKLLVHESCFFFGVGLGGFLAVALYQTCFQRKHYLLVVSLNSIMILWKVACNAFIYLDLSAIKEWHTDPFHRIIDGELWYKDLAWGMFENSAIFMMTILLPSILAINHRSKYGVQMIGTILGISLSIMYIFALGIVSLIQPIMH